MFWPPFWRSWPCIGKCWVPFCTFLLVPLQNKIGEKIRKMMAHIYKSYYILKKKKKSNSRKKEKFYKKFKKDRETTMRLIQFPLWPLFISKKEILFRKVFFTTLVLWCFGNLSFWQKKISISREEEKCLSKDTFEPKQRSEIFVVHISLIDKKK